MTLPSCNNLRPYRFPLNLRGVLAMTQVRADDGAPATRPEAQARADRIEAFRQELAALDRAGVLRLGAEDRERVEAYHAGMLDDLAARFDVDRSERQRRMSLGMRVATLLGALTLSAAVVFFFYRVWGLLGTATQVLVLVSAPLVLLAAAEAFARRERTLYVTSIMAVTATAAFVLDLSTAGAIFNLRPSPFAPALWAAFALIVAYRYELRLLLAAGLAMAGWAACAIVGWVAGLDISAWGARPEPLLPLGALAVAFAASAPNRRRPGFSEVWRLGGLAALLLPLVLLSTWSEAFSYIRLPGKTLGAIYDAAGFALGGAAIWLGFQKGWTRFVQAAAGFLVLFLYVKCFDWLWDWMPRYLFFLLLGGIAVAAVIALGRVRSRRRRL